MQTLKQIEFGIFCLLLAILVVGGLYVDAPECRPSDQPEPINPPKIKDSHEMGRRLFAYICHKMNERN